MGPPFGIFDSAERAMFALRKSTMMNLIDTKVPPDVGAVSLLPGVLRDVNDGRILLAAQSHCLYVDLDAKVLSVFLMGFASGKQRIRGSNGCLERPVLKLFDNDSNPQLKRASTRRQANNESSNRDAQIDTLTTRLFMCSWRASREPSNGRHLHARGRVRFA
ncbi:hypothetical protein U1Q18_044843 [Sarracenia purpurea var. burkii]